MINIKNAGALLLLNQLLLLLIGVLTITGEPFHPDVYKILAVILWLLVTGAAYLLFNVDGNSSIKIKKTFVVNPEIEKYEKRKKRK